MSKPTVPALPAVRLTDDGRVWHFNLHGNSLETRAARVAAKAYSLNAWKLRGPNRVVKLTRVQFKNALRQEARALCAANPELGARYTMTWAMYDYEVIGTFY